MSRHLLIAMQCPGEPLFTPATVLLAIHSIDPAKEGLSDGVKRLMAALNVCMQQRDVFNADSLALVLNQLVQR
jgi:symplekin